MRKCATKQPMDFLSEENQTGNQKYRETNENENMMIQNIWDAAKGGLRGKITARKA